MYYVSNPCTNRALAVTGRSLLVLAAALTFVVAARTLWYLLQSVTNVPYMDQWVMLEEIRRMREGRSSWSYLWTPYWGQRILLPRLLFFLSARYFHYSVWPLVLINVAVQLSLVFLLIWVIWRLFHGHTNPAFWLSVIALVHLLLSSLQMEILIEGMEVQYTIGYGSAVASICILGSALSSQGDFEPRFWGAILLGIVATTCLAIGPLIWPVLIFEAMLSAKRRNWHVVSLVAIAALVAVAYAVGYTRPAIGMGFSGILHHPMSGLSIIALVLGGPISLYSRCLGVVAGTIGMVIACGLLLYLWRNRYVKPVAISLMMVVCFLFASAVSIAVGRLSPEWLATHTAQPLPSRYLAPTFIFWATLFAVSLTCWSVGRVGRMASGTVFICVLILTFGTWNWQWRLSREWAAAFQEFDAIASGFILSVSDQEFMSRVFPVEDIRNCLVNYMRRERLSIFAEPRAAWVGEEIDTLARVDDRKVCHATITKALSLSDSNPPSLRIIGAVTVDGKPPGRTLDVLITNNTRTVAGLARTLPAESEGKAMTEFLGYTRGISLQTARVFLLLPNNTLCAAQLASN